MNEEEKQEKQCNAIASILEIEDIDILENVKTVLLKRIDELITIEDDEIKFVKDSYPDGICPDCSDDISETAGEGSECDNCGHVFWCCGDNQQHSFNNPDS